MKRTYSIHRGIRLGAITILAASFALGSATSGVAAEIRAIGSDTLLEVAGAWAQAYKKLKPSVSVSPKGGGSGIGIAALQNNNTEIANASREMKPEEKAKVKESTGKEAKEFVIGYDALAVYTHKKNPIKEISVEDLREIWAEGGTITTWDQVAGEGKEQKGQIVLVG